MDSRAHKPLPAQALARTSAFPALARTSACLATVGPAGASYCRYRRPAPVLVMSISPMDVEKSCVATAAPGTEESHPQRLLRGGLGASTCQ